MIDFVIDPIAIAKNYRKGLLTPHEVKVLQAINTERNVVNSGTYDLTHGLVENWAREMFVTEETISGQHVGTIYEAYRGWAISKTLIPMKKASFSKQLNTLFGAVSKVVHIDGKSVRIYVLMS